MPFGGPDGGNGGNGGHVIFKGKVGFICLISGCSHFESKGSRKFEFHNQSSTRRDGQQQMLSRKKCPTHNRRGNQCFDCLMCSFVSFLCAR